MTTVSRTGTGTVLNMEETLELALRELRRIVRSVRGYREMGMSTTDVINEVYFKVRSAVGEGLPRRSFNRVAGRVIRNYLTDKIREHNAQKRGGELERVELIDIAGRSYSMETILHVDRALTQLYEENLELAEFVDLTFFAGFSEQELAEHFEVSGPTVQRRLRLDRAWLKDKLGTPLDKHDSR